MDVDTTDEYNTTALMRAAIIGDLEEVKSLLAQGADVNARPNGSPPALYYAMETHCTPEMVKTLLEAGADVNAMEPGRHTILMRAMLNTDQAIVRMLLETGADVNAIDYYDNRTSCNVHVGLTALMVAAARTDGAQIVPLLLAKGAEPNVRGECGRTALSVAKSVENTEVISLLEELAARS